MTPPSMKASIYLKTRQPVIQSSTSAILMLRLILGKVIVLLCINLMVLLKVKVVIVTMKKQIFQQINVTILWEEREYINEGDVDK